MIVRELLTKWGIRVDDKQLKAFDRQIRETKKTATASLNQIRSASLQAGAAFITAGAGLGFFLKAAGDFEQAQVAFETMLGSAERAQVLLKDIQEFAKQTPFDLPQLIEGSKRVLAFGFAQEKVIPTLEKLGNIAAGVGRDKFPQLLLAFGQVRAATKLRGQELRQFTEAGVPLLEELAKQLGKTESQVQEMVSAGQIGFPLVEKALENLTTGNGRFANLMVRQSKTFLGLLSNMRDAFVQLAIEIGQSILPEAKAFAAQILQVAEANKELIKTELSKFLKTSVNLMKNLAFIFGRVFILVNFLARAFGGLNGLLDFTSKLFAALIAAKLLAGIGGLILAFGNVIKTIRAVGIAALFTNASVASIPIVIGLMAVAIALLFEDILAFFRGDKSIVGLIDEGIDKIAEKFKTLPSIVRGIAALILFPLRTLLVGIRTVGAALGALSQGDFGLALDAVKTGLLESVTPNIGSLRNLIGLEDGNSGFVTPSSQGVGAGAGGGTTVNIDAPVSVPAGTPPELIGPAITEGVERAIGTKLRQSNEVALPRVKF